MQSESLQVDLTKSFVEKVFTESALPSIMGRKHFKLKLFLFFERLY